MLAILAAHNPEEHVLPHRFFKLFSGNLNFGVRKIPILNIDFGPTSFNFTNHLLMTLVAAGLCLLVLPRFARAYAQRSGDPQAPRGLANLFDFAFTFVRDVAKSVLGHRTDAFMPFLWTLFFFILFCNLLGLIPLDSIIYLLSGRKLQHIGGTATGNLAVTGGLALCSLFAIHVSGVRAVYHGLRDGSYGAHHGEGHGDSGAAHEAHSHHAAAHGASSGKAAALALPLYIWNFAPHVFKPDPHSGAITRMVMSVADLLMWALLLVLEMLGAVIKPFALMIRLFANMIAGHIVLASILSLTFIMGSYAVGAAASIGCALLSLLELFVAFLQAYIFVFLTTLFIGAAVAPEH